MGYSGSSLQSAPSAQQQARFLMKLAPTERTGNVHLLLTLSFSKFLHFYLGENRRKGKVLGSF